MKNSKILLTILLCLGTMFAQAQETKQDSIQVKTDSQNSKVTVINTSKEASVMLDFPAERKMNFKNSKGIDSKPLILVDGKVIGDNDMKLILPENIESINILKNEKAIAEYGSNGKDGVILITMKKEK